MTWEHLGTAVLVLGFVAGAMRWAWSMVRRWRSAGAAAIVAGVKAEIDVLRTDFAAHDRADTSRFARLDERFDDLEERMGRERTEIARQVDNLLAAQLGVEQRQEDRHNEYVLRMDRILELAVVGANKPHGQAGAPR